MIEQKTDWSFRYAGPAKKTDNRFCKGCAAVADKKCSVHTSEQVGCVECRAAKLGSCPTHCGLEEAVRDHDVVSTDPEQFGLRPAKRVEPNENVGHGDNTGHMDRFRLEPEPRLTARADAAKAQFEAVGAFLVSYARALPDGASIDVTVRGETINGIHTTNVEFVGRG